MPDSKLTLRAGDRALVVRNRYKALATANDFLTGLWFLVGSILFLSESTKTLGTAFFIAGSAELLIRPAIKLVRDLHVKRIDPNGGGDRPTGH